jgi:hypothetical protein
MKFFHRRSSWYEPCWSDPKGHDLSIGRDGADLSGQATYDQIGGRVVIAA